MSNFFARQGGAYINEVNRGLGALLGIATGVLADGQLSDAEIRFLDDWLKNNSAIATTWPGDVIHARIKSVLADGRISEDERAHLVTSLQQLVGGTLAELAASTHVTQLLPYEEPAISYPNSTFCLTGDFVFGPRNICAQTISGLGSIVKSGVSKRIQYLIVGGLGSDEWKHGSFGTKVEKAMELKNSGACIAIVHEDYWANCLPRSN
ncbi:hypothetical protein PY254_01850 [Rhodanobacter sp. AS-Z3]|uniref:hypothetical protein n=1 Tax=Rhodanobacter sp. AS-Z3 TaxID=3031330 RepID=UPI00247AD493|nr:hypothetical protein [Rhodanobacter sp. AS-Z3]WEN15444.1 hypothetical protein PY254_01850 [Rhodanobacter sp. AS-Z3]